VSRVIYTFVLVAALAACGKKKEESAPATGSATPVVVADAAGSAAGSAEGSAAVAEPLDVPTEVDFEDLATTEITDKNVEARVKAIEQELAE
jgi:hypothetical protein